MNNDNFANINENQNLTKQLDKIIGFQPSQNKRIDPITNYLEIRNTIKPTTATNYQNFSNPVLPYELRRDYQKNKEIDPNYLIVKQNRYNQNNTRLERDDQRSRAEIWKKEQQEMHERRTRFFAGNCEKTDETCGTKVIPSNQESTLNSFANFPNIQDKDSIRCRDPSWYGGQGPVPNYRKDQPSYSFSDNSARMLENFVGYKRPEYMQRKGEVVNGPLHPDMSVPRGLQKGVYQVDEWLERNANVSENTKYNYAKPYPQIKDLPTRNIPFVTRQEDFYIAPHEDMSKNQRIKPKTNHIFNPRLSATGIKYQNSEELSSFFKPQNTKRWKKNKQKKNHIQDGRFPHFTTVENLKENPIDPQYQQFNQKYFQHPTKFNKEKTTISNHLGSVSQQIIPEQNTSRMYEHKKTDRSGLLDKAETLINKFITPILDIPGQKFKSQQLHRNAQNEKFSLEKKNNSSNHYYVPDKDFNNQQLNKISEQERFSKERIKNSDHYYFPDDVQKTLMTPSSIKENAKQNVFDKTELKTRNSQFKNLGFENMRDYLSQIEEFKEKNQIVESERQEIEFTDQVKYQGKSFNQQEEEFNHQDELENENVSHFEAPDYQKQSFVNFANQEKIISNEIQENKRGVNNFYNEKNVQDMSRNFKENDQQMDFIDKGGKMENNYKTNIAMDTNKIGNQAPRLFQDDIVSTDMTNAITMRKVINPETRMFVRNNSTLASNVNRINNNVYESIKDNVQINDDPTRISSNKSQNVPSPMRWKPEYVKEKKNNIGSRNNFENNLSRDYLQTCSQRIHPAMIERNILQEKSDRDYDDNDENEE